MILFSIHIKLYTDLCAFRCLCLYTEDPEFKLPKHKTIRIDDNTRKTAVIFGSSKFKDKFLFKLKQNKRYYNILIVRAVPSGCCFFEYYDLKARTFRSIYPNDVRHNRDLLDTLREIMHQYTMDCEEFESNPPWIREELASIT